MRGFGVSSSEERVARLERRVSELGGSGEGSD